MVSNPSDQETEIAIDVQGIRKTFGLLEAVRGISFQLKRGEFLTLFGPNGAGKTTLLKILSGLTKPSSGTAVISGYDIVEGNPALRSEIGVISHSACLYEDLTPLENMLFYAKMYSLESPRERSVQVIEEVGLKSRMNDRVHTFSRGMLQRLTIARAIIHNPSILFLDEPYTGLDQHAAILLKEQLAQLHTEGRTVIMTTHDLDRGLEMCDKVAIQVRGKFVCFESGQDLERTSFLQKYFDAVESNK